MAADRLAHALLVLACLLGAGGVTPARGSEPSGPQGSPHKDAYPLPDTVEVAAERLPLDPMRVPVAATLIQGPEWSDTRLAGVDEALATVPGVVAQTRSGGQDVRVTIRGFGARGAGERSNAGTTRGIRISLDGFPLTEPDGRTSLDLADVGLVNSIRVVRSNTSGLFGPASGGLIDLYSSRTFTRPFVEMRAEFGSFGYARQQGRVGFTSGSSRFQFSLATSNFDGWRTHSGGAQTTFFVSVLSEPSPQTTVDIFVAGTRNLQRQPGALTQSEVEADPTQADPAYVAQNTRRDNRIGRVGVKVDHRLGGERALRVAGFVEPKTLHRSERGRYRDFQRVHTGGTALYTFPIAGVVSGLRLTAGLDDAYQDGSVLFYDLGPGGTRGDELVANQREGINTFGTFLELTAAPARDWEVTAGARWDFAHYISEDHIDPALSDSRTIDRVSPRAALQWRFQPEQSLYTALSSGVEFPAFNEIDPPAPYDTLTSLNPLLDPAYSLTWEVGAKGDLPFGSGFRTIRYDLALYTLEVRNDIVPWNAGAYYLTAGKSRRSGVELGVSAGAEAGLSLGLSVTASRNRYVDYETGLPDDEDNLVTVSYDDNESAGIPPLALHASARYGFASGPFIEGSFRRIGAYYANDANTDRVEDSNVFDLTVGTKHRFGETVLRLFLSGRNLADAAYIGSAYVNGINGRYLEPGMERNVLLGLELGYASGP